MLTAFLMTQENAFFLFDIRADTRPTQYNTIQYNTIQSFPFLEKTCPDRWLLSWCFSDWLLSPPLDVYHADKISARTIHDCSDSFLTFWPPPMTYDILDSWFRGHQRFMTFDTTDYLILMTVESRLWPEYKQKWSHPDSNWGPKNQNLICCPYTMEPFRQDDTPVYLCSFWLFP